MSESGSSISRGAMVGSSFSFDSCCSSQVLARILTNVTSSGTSTQVARRASRACSIEATMELQPEYSSVDSLDDPLERVTVPIKCNEKFLDVFRTAHFHSEIDGRVAEIHAEI